MSDTPSNDPTPGGSPPPPTGGDSWAAPPPPSMDSPASDPVGDSWAAPPPPAAPPAPDWGAQPGYAGQSYATGAPPQHYGTAPPGYEQKEKLVAGLLGVFLGAWGIHSFYLGDSKKGIIQIVVSIVTCGIGGLWGFIEGIMILMGKINVDANGVPLKG